MRRRKKSGQPRVGKLYNLAARLIADELVWEIDEIEAAECYLVSQIGRPIGQPRIVEIRIRPAADAALMNFRSRIEDAVTANLRRLNRVADDLLDGRLGFDRWLSRTKPGTTVRA
jgi:S-adenosylmethionine synthetase